MLPEINMILGEEVNQPKSDHSVDLSASSSCNVYQLLLDIGKSFHSSEQILVTFLFSNSEIAFGSSLSEYCSSSGAGKNEISPITSLFQ